MMLPEKYLNKMKELLNDEYSEYEDSFNSPSYHGLRVNTLKISVEEFKKTFPFKIEEIPWTTDGFYYEDEKVNKHPYYYAGLYYLQEPSAMLPAEVLPIDENDIVLDTCAAPGGKSTKLLTKLNNTGILVSNDISSSRQLATLRNLERFGGKNYFVISEDISKLENKYSQCFDKILVDAPCSGEGMFRKDPSLIKSWKEKGPNYYSSVQKKIVNSAMNLLKDGGLLVYSTCTFDKKEDEEIIEYILNNFDAEVMPIKQFDGFVSNEYGTKLFPHRIKGEGHFVSLIKKHGEKTSNRLSSTCLKPEYLNSIKIDFKNGNFKVINNGLYFMPDFDTSSIRVLRSGLLLGELKKEKFEPSQQLALALKESEFDKVINLDVDDQRIIKYLKGETVNLSEFNFDGYVLICVNHFPIGFGKITKGLFKNKIDKGWIYQ